MWTGFSASWIGCDGRARLSPAWGLKRGIAPAGTGGTRGAAAGSSVLLAGLTPQEREVLLDLLDKAIRGAKMETGRRQDGGKGAFSGGIDDAQTSGLQSRGSKHTRFLLRLWACIAACPRDGALGQRRET